MHLLVFGKGWMGRQWHERVTGSVWCDTDIADADAVAGELDRVRPDRVLNAAGKTGDPNVDALEGKPGSTFRSNVIGPIVLAQACADRGIHLTHLGSGCIYAGDNGGRGFGEEDEPNFHGSLYARSKILAEEALREFDVLQLRVRLPFSSVPHRRNLLTKLLAFDRVVRVSNSVTVLEDAWPVAEVLIRRGESGVWNLVNDGLEHHDEVLRAWQERVEPAHAFEVVEERSLGLQAARSNCVLSTRKLADAGLSLPDFAETLPRMIDAYARHQRD